LHPCIVDLAFIEFDGSLVLADRRSLGVELLTRHGGASRYVQGGTFAQQPAPYGVDSFSDHQSAGLHPGRRRMSSGCCRLAVCPWYGVALTLTLSCDHRAVDGARAGAFLQMVAETLEEPAVLVT
jgi:hypothetical protein